MAYTKLELNAIVDAIGKAIESLELNREAELRDAVMHMVGNDASHLMSDVEYLRKIDYASQARLDYLIGLKVYFEEIKEDRKV